MSQPRIALVSARAAQGKDEDLPPLLEALRECGAWVVAANWDDAEIDWPSFDLALLRSTWDYSLRFSEFRVWAERVAAQTRLLNPLAVVSWNTDKHYLATLAAAGVPIVPTRFIEPGEDSAAAIGEFLRLQATAELVVKPAVGSGSRDVQRHPRADRAGMRAHADRLLAAGRSVFLQPYLERVDTDGETALIYFSGHLSHAIRKGPLLRAGEGPTPLLFAPEEITPRTPRPDELEVGARALAVSPGVPLLYARVDLIRDEEGHPRLLELELTEPSLFFNHAPGSAQRFAREILRAMGDTSTPART